MYIRYKLVTGLKAAYGSSEMYFDMDSVFGGSDHDAIKQKKLRSMPSIALQKVTHARFVIHPHMHIDYIPIIRVLVPVPGRHDFLAWAHKTTAATEEETKKADQKIGK